MTLLKAMSNGSCDECHKEISIGDEFCFVDDMVVHPRCEGAALKHSVLADEIGSFTPVSARRSE